jgi:hypothetical protein
MIKAAKSAFQRNFSANNENKWNHKSLLSIEMIFSESMIKKNFSDTIDLKNISIFV